MDKLYSITKPKKLVTHELMKCELVSNDCLKNDKLNDDYLILEVYSDLNKIYYSNKYNVMYKRIVKLLENANFDKITNKDGNKEIKLNNILNLSKLDKIPKPYGFIKKSKTEISTMILNAIRGLPRHEYYGCTDINISNIIIYDNGLCKIDIYENNKHKSKPLYMHTDCLDSVWNNYLIKNKFKYANTDLFNKISCYFVPFKLVDKQFIDFRPTTENKFFTGNKAEVPYDIIISNKYKERLFNLAINYEDIKDCFIDDLKPNEFLILNTRDLSDGDVAQVLKKEHQTNCIYSTYKMGFGF